MPWDQCHCIVRMMQVTEGGRASATAGSKHRHRRGPTTTSSPTVPRKVSLLSSCCSSTSFVAAASTAGRDWDNDRIFITLLPTPSSKPLEDAHSVPGVTCAKASMHSSGYNFKKKGSLFLIDQWQRAERQGSHTLRIGGDGIALLPASCGVATDRKGDVRDCITAEAPTRSAWWWVRIAWAEPSPPNDTFHGNGLGTAVRAGAVPPQHAVGPNRRQLPNLGSSRLKGKCAVVSEPGVGHCAVVNTIKGSCVSSGGLT